MPALPPSQGVTNLLAYWGSIQAAASQRLGVAGAWAALRTALNLGPTTAVSGVASLQDMNTVYGLAVGNRSAGEAFAAATPDAAIDASMIGSTPNARAASVAEASPLYNIRTQYSYTTTGETKSDWVTVQVPQSLTGFTVGDLQAMVETLASAIITSYGITTVAFTGLAISAA